MGSHTFAGMMYHLYRALGLFKEVKLKDGEEQNEQLHTFIKISNFSSHQSFFENRYKDVIKTLDSREVYSLKERYNIFYKYEQLYNALMHTSVFTRQDNECVYRQYLKLVMSPIIALDIIKTLVPEDDEHFYYHIHRFLRSEYCPIKENDERSTYSGVQKYLRNYIKELSLPDHLDMEPIYGFIRNIKADEVQRNATIGQKAAIVFNDWKVHPLTKKNDSAVFFKIQKISTAYTVLMTILDFERLTSCVNILALHYNHFVDKGIERNKLAKQLCQYLYSPGYNPELLLELTSILSKNATTSIRVNIENEAHCDVLSLERIIFDPFTLEKYTAWDCMDILTNFGDSAYFDLLGYYFKVVELLELIRNNELIKADDFVNSISLENLPVGYLTSAFESIKLALRLKLKMKGIRKGSLINHVNITMAFQGVYTDYISPSLTEHSESITSYDNNLTILRSIKIYNSLVWKLGEDSSDDSFNIYPQSIYGLLDKIDRALGKINKVFNNSNIDIKPEKLAKLIIEKNILTKPETNGNLIGFLDKCTLYNCMSDLDNVVRYLRAPRENVINIMKLHGGGERSIIMRKTIAETILLVNKIRG